MIKKVAKIESNIHKSILYKKYFWAFLVFCLSGFVSVFTDFDHIEPYLFSQIPLTFESLGSRTYHIPILFVFGIVWVYSHTYLHRLALVVLKNNINEGEKLK